MALHPLLGIARMLLLAQLGPVAYFGAVAWEGSSRLIDPSERSSGCLTPGHLGWTYEAVNYDRATDDRLLLEDDPMACRGAPEPAGRELLSADGVPLAAWWIPAASGTASAASAVVMVHGYADNKSGMLRYAVLLHEHYDLVLFDLRNSGQSGGRWTTQGVGEQRDVAAVIDWLVRTHGPRRIAVFGQSMGGEASVNWVASDDRVDALILDSTHDRLETPVLSGMRRLGLPFGTATLPLMVQLAEWRSGEDLTAGDPVDAVGRLGSRPLLLLHGGGDLVDPLPAARALHQAALDRGVDVQLHVCPAADHGELDTVCSDDYPIWLETFLDRALAA
ncbi:MAG: alpha/beta hydrolase [Candidatus Limnocylindria bacterium]